MKRVAGLFAAIALLAGASGAYAASSVSSHSITKIDGKKAMTKKKIRKSSKRRVVQDFAGVPQARIRGGDGVGLSPLAFAYWIKSHPKLANADRSLFRQTSSATRLLNRSANHFAEADSNGDGRVSPVELADFVAEVPRYRTFNDRA